MTTKKLDGDRPILYFGDNHGRWDDLFFQIKTKNISDVNIISVGDLGVGFNFKKDIIEDPMMNKKIYKNVEVIAVNKNSKL